MSNVKERVLTLCLERNVKVGTLERMANMSNGTISKWTSSTIPNGATLQTIADFFNVSIDYILGRAPSADFPSDGTISYSDAIRILMEKEEMDASAFSEKMEEEFFPIAFEYDKASFEAKRLNTALSKNIKKQKEYDTNFDSAVAIRRFFAELIKKATNKEYPPDVYAAYLNFDVNLYDLCNPSKPRTKERMDDAKERNAHKWGDVSDLQPENSPALPASPELQAMIEKMVEEQVKKQLQEANADVGKAKKAE